MQDEYFCSCLLRSQINMVKKKTYIILGLVILIIGGIYYWKSRPAKISYITETAKVGTITKTVSATGKIVPKKKVDLAFKLNGRLKFLSVDIGDVVKKGEKIAMIDKGTLENELAKAKNEVRVQKKILANMKKHKSTYNYQQKDIQRTQIKKAQDVVDSIITTLKETTLYAPLDGIVATKNIEVGENVIANSPVLTIASQGEPDIEIDVPESDIMAIKVGQKANLTFDALPSDEILTGKVTEIDPVATVIQDVVYYKIKIALDKLDTRLKLGMSVDADINVFQKDGVVIIPLRAVKTEGGKKYVEILKPENKIEKVAVQTGHKGDDGTVEITTGLQGREKVVVLTSKK